MMRATARATKQTMRRAAISFADAASIAALASKCSPSAPFGATFADDRRLATRFQDIVLCRASLSHLAAQCSTINPSGDSRAVGCGVSCMLCTGDKEARLIASVNVPACNSQESKPRTPKMIKLAAGETLATSA